MRRINIALLTLGIILIVGLTGASQYEFGSKVTAQDIDVGRPLYPFIGPTNPPQSYTIGVWDIGSNPGVYDNGDVVYLAKVPLTPIPALPVVSANDIRLTSFGNQSPGSKVTPNDNDIGMPLQGLPAPASAFGQWTFVYLDLYGGTGQYDLADPVYLTHLPGATITTNDVRLTAADGNVAGTKVRNFDPDNDQTYTLGWGLPLGIPFPLGALPADQWVAYFDVNGNGVYDYPDDVYLLRGPPKSAAIGYAGAALPGFTVVTPNDVRLSGPV